MLPSRSQRSNLAGSTSLAAGRNQENNLNLHQQQQHQFHKTPARAAQPAANGKQGGLGGGAQPLQTAKTGQRVLGQKDANKGKGSTEPIQFQINKQQQQQPVAGPSCAPSAPPVASTSTSTNQQQHLLKTPSPSVRKYAALSFVSPDVVAGPELSGSDGMMVVKGAEVDGLEQEQEEEEVEGNGGTNRDWEEPFISEVEGFNLPNFKELELGKLSRQLAFFSRGGGRNSFGVSEEDGSGKEEEGCVHKIDLEDLDLPRLIISPFSFFLKHAAHSYFEPKTVTESSSSFTTKSLFPVPPTRSLKPSTTTLNNRTPFQKPSTTKPLSSSLTSTSRPRPSLSTTTQPRPLPRPPVTSSLVNRTTSSSVGPTKSAIPPSRILPTTTTSTTINKPTPRIPPPSSLKPRSFLPPSSSSRPLTTSSTRPSTSTLRTHSKSSSSSISSINSLKVKSLKEKEEDLEAELGVWGVVGFEDAGRKFGENGEEEEGEEFRFEI